MSCPGEGDLQLARALLKMEPEAQNSRWGWAGVSTVGHADGTGLSWSSRLLIFGWGGGRGPCRRVTKARIQVPAAPVIGHEPLSRTQLSYPLGSPCPLPWAREGEHVLL